ncbi:MAG: hypothetical protein KF678_00785 [Phycisphaeraceae bacterium]|nr:hypothetical protein [Phycisphaeraceae bacterium]
MNPPAIDWLILTAANRAQARGYRAQLRLRQATGRLPGVARYLVIPDPHDRRIGSGGSTFVVLHELLRRLRSTRRAKSPANPFANQRILLIHSGGDSRRLPAYAAEGKVFVPIPNPHLSHADEPTTLFDLILADLNPLVRPGRLLIATGDVLLGIAQHNPDLSAPGTVGVAFPGSPDVGSRHGVYICNRRAEVTDFLQKPDLPTARRHKALDHRGRLLIDTGLLSLDSAASLKWARASATLVRQFQVGRGESIDLYAQLLPALYGRTSTNTLFNAFRLPFHAAIVPSCDFLHIGSTRELLHIATTHNSTSHRAAQLNSIIAAPLTQHPSSLIESSRITHRSGLGNNSLLVGFPGGMPIRIPDHIGMAFLPIGRADWAAIAFGVNDDFKTPFQRGGTFLNASPPPQVLGKHNSLTTFWDLRCWPVGPLKSVLTWATRLAASRSSLPPPSSRPHLASLANLIPRVNIDRLLSHRHTLQSERAAAHAAGLLRANQPPPAHLVRNLLPSHRPPLLALLNARLKAERHPFTVARLHHLASILQPARAAAHDTLAFASIAEGVATQAPAPPPAPRAAISPSQVVTVSAPVRLDLCGGWSDTPPICHELGGTVVNSAITLRHRHPIEVRARLIPEPVLRLRSLDLGRACTIISTTEARSHHDPHDWAALPKAALLLAGITPSRGSLRRRLASFGGGIELTLSVDVPKGSGLGTSSILGAAVLACLDRLCGRSISSPLSRSSARSLIERTSILEQMMSTAGGWQDQAGGLTPGLKLLRTSPGPRQIPRISPITLPAAAAREFRSRTILYYTGQRRLARDILQGVVRRYLAADPAALRIVHDLKAAATRMARDLAEGDIDAFAAGLLRNWELKKAIDPGSTNARIEQILAPLLPHLSGYELAGAGGGGFLLLIARSPRHATHIRAMLAHSPQPGSAVVDFDIDTRGLALSVTEATHE